MNYKKLSIVLAILLILSVGLIVDITYQHAQENKSQADTFENMLTRFNVTSGSFISADTAHFMLESYHKFRKGRNPFYKREKTAYGFAFGLTKMDSLLSSIHAHNERNTDPKKEIIGIRVYFSRSVPKANVKSFNEVFIIPVIADRLRNLYPIDNMIDKNFLSGDSLILNSSTPCPNLCD